MKNFFLFFFNFKKAQMIDTQGTITALVSILVVYTVLGIGLDQFGKSGDALNATGVPFGQFVTSN